MTKLRENQFLQSHNFQGELSPEMRWKNIFAYNAFERIDFEKSILQDLKNYSIWTYEHSLNTEKLALEIGRYLFLSDEQLDILAAAARLHDIGKLSVPLKILNKEGSLTVDERSIINRHAEHGFTTLKESRLYPMEVCIAVREHHLPYPRMTMPSMITEILQAADCAEAMLSERPYKPARTAEDVANEFIMEAGDRYRAEIAVATADVLEHFHRRGECYAV